MAISAFGLNCTLKRGTEPSSTQKLLDQVLRAIGRHQATTSFERLANLDIKPGVCTDEGDGDAWPAVRKRILDANILVLATPIWMGHPSSIAQRVLERMDAFLDEIDGKGRYPTFGRVAVVAVVGNEDGAHHVHAEMMQGWPTWASPFLEAAIRTGLAKRSATPTTSTSIALRERFPKRSRESRVMQRTSPDCCRPGHTPEHDVGAVAIRTPRCGVRRMALRWFSCDWRSRPSDRSKKIDIDAKGQIYCGACS
jgi:multimeric flavodoxin WrbA